VKLGVTKNIDWGVFENRVLRKIFGPKGEYINKRQEKLPLTNFMLCTPHQILSGCTN